jgi:excisionase family DNA binding protein
MEQTEILTLRQAATRLQVSDRTLLELLSAGAISGQKVGTQWRFRAADVEAYASRGTAQGTQRGSEGAAAQPGQE